MLRRIIVFCVMMMVLTSAAMADVTIQMLDPETKMLRISYIITDVDAGAKELVFPPSGFDFAAGALKVLTAFNVDTMEVLKVEPVTVAGKKVPTAVRIDYGRPIPQGEKLTLRFTVEIPSASFHTDSAGRWVLDYTTSHELRFVVPRGHQLVWASTPVRIEEDGGQILAVFDAPWDDRRAVDFRFKTRPLQ